MRETEEQRVRLSSSIGSAILGADVEQRGDGRWVCKGEEETLRDLSTVELQGMIYRRWVRCRWFAEDGGDGFAALKQKAKTEKPNFRVARAMGSWVLQK